MGLTSMIVAGIIGFSALSQTAPPLQQAQRPMLEKPATLASEGALEQ